MVERGPASSLTDIGQWILSLLPAERTGASETFIIADGGASGSPHPGHTGHLGRFPFKLGVGLSASSLQES